MDISGFRCSLSGNLMVDPVVVCSTSDPVLRRGESYERADLENWLAQRGDTETCYVPNPMLKDLIIAWHGVELNEMM